MSNTGHGHVHPREDGVKARCGGPGICPECRREAGCEPATSPLRPTAANVLLVDVMGCARCDQNHPNVVFKKMARPLDPKMPFHGVCPLTQEPILLAGYDAGGGR